MDRPATSLHSWTWEINYLLHRQVVPKLTSLWRNAASFLKFKRKNKIRNTKLNKPHHRQNQQGLPAQQFSFQGYTFSKSSNLLIENQKGDDLQIFGKTEQGRKILGAFNHQTGLSYNPNQIWAFTATQVNQMVNY